MGKAKIKLTKEKETLLIPLYCKYLESQKESPIIKDEKAIEMVDAIDYDFDQLEIPKQTYVTVCMRAKQFDNYTKTYLKDVPESIVIHMGCGLDSRFHRVDNKKVEWYDLDFREVIELRKHFYKESDRYHFISSSVTELSWLDRITTSNKPVIILAEGLFMYLTEDEIKSLLNAIQNKFLQCTLIFDSYSALTAKRVKNHPSIKKTGAVINWGINNAKDMELWNTKLHFLEEWYFTQSEELSKLDPGYRFLFKFIGLFPIAKKAHRILVFTMGD